MKKQKISPMILISACVVGVAILGILGFRIFSKLGNGDTSSIWMDFALVAIAIVLVVRVIINYKKDR